MVVAVSKDEFIEFFMDTVVRIVYFCSEQRSHKMLLSKASASRSVPLTERTTVPSAR